MLVGSDLCTIGVAIMERLTSDERAINWREESDYGAIYVRIYAVRERLVSDGIARRERLWSDRGTIYVRL